MIMWTCARGEAWVSQCVSSFVLGIESLKYSCMYGTCILTTRTGARAALTVRAPNSRTVTFLILCAVAVHSPDCARE